MALSVISDEYTLISEKLKEDCLRMIFVRYLSDNDLIVSGKVDPKLNKVVHEILLGKRELKLIYQYDYKDDILEAIKIAGKNLQKFHIAGKLDSDFFEVIHVFCPLIKTLDIELYQTNSFRINLNLTELQDLKIKWMLIKDFLTIPEKLGGGIGDFWEKSSKLQNLHIIYFNERHIEEMKFPSSLKGLRIDCSYNWYAQNLLDKIQKECKEIEILALFRCWIKREDLETLKEMGRNCENIKFLELNFSMYGYLDVSFLSEFPNLKEFKNEDLSQLKNFGFKLIKNKHLKNFEKFNSLEMMTFYDHPFDWNKTEKFWDFFFKILPHLENVDIIEFVYMKYEDSFYGRMKSLTENRDKKIRIRIKNWNRKIIPKDENDKFIIEEWSYCDYEKIHKNLF